MHYINLIQKTIDYIDDHISEDLSVEALASIAGFSTFHYYKVFSSFTHLSVMDYITKRRLQFALNDLTNGAKIIDIAMNYGFETHAGFNKAFKKAFGYPPSLYRLQAPKGMPPKINLKYLKENLIGGIVMAVGVEDFDKATDDMYKLEIPTTTYAVFTSPAVPEAEFVDSIKGTWRYILQEWFPNSQYQVDETKYDFEFYDERCHPWQYDKLSMEIYIPIKER